MPSARRYPTLAAIAVLATACDRGAIAEDSARMAADTAATSVAPPTAGPVPSPGAADADLVMAATEFEITDQNFQQFLRASEALSYLRARDASVRAVLEQASAAPDTAPVLEQLESHPQIVQAINGAGMSVRDYYVMSIALASAQRYAANPQAAPPTPVGRKNAEWVQRNKSQVARLRTWGAAVSTG